MATRTKKPPLVFISHDSRDAELAKAFADLLKDASGGHLRHFCSSEKGGKGGLRYGDEWYPAIMSKLDEATEVVALFTRRSVDRPWILYEIGVAKGKLDKPAYGIALGVSLEEACRGPFGQFENCPDDEGSLTALILQLVRSDSDADPREETIRKHVREFLEKKSEILARYEEPESYAVLKAKKESLTEIVEDFVCQFRLLSGAAPKLSQASDTEQGIQNDDARGRRPGQDRGRTEPVDQGEDRGSGSGSAGADSRRGRPSGRGAKKHLQSSSSTNLRSRKG